MRSFALKKLLNFKRWSVLAGGVLAFAATIEICARVDDLLRYDASLMGRYSADNLRGSEDGIPCNVPQATFEKWHNNSYGFRGWEVSLTKPPGSTRIVCLGASESYGLYESTGKEWPAQLQQLLAHRGYEVINASVAGLALKKFVTYFDTYVAPFNPDVVVLVVNPLFYVTSLERGKPAGGASAVARAPSAEKPVAPSGVQVSELRCLPKAKEVLKQGIASSFPRLWKKWELRSLQGQITEIERQRLKGRKAKDLVPPGHLASFHDDLSATVAAMRSRGARVVLTTYPALIGKDNLDRYPEIFLDNRRFCIELTLRGMADAFERFNAEIASVAVEQGTLLADTHTLIPKSTEFFGDNVHYRDKGARLFAEGVATALERGAVAALVRGAKPLAASATAVNRP